MFVMADAVDAVDGYTPAVRRVAIAMNILIMEKIWDEIRKEDITRAKVQWHARF